jgi:hypothetical protein
MGGYAWTIGVYSYVTFWLGIWVVSPNPCRCAVIRRCRSASHERQWTGGQALIKNRDLYRSASILVTGVFSCKRRARDSVIPTDTLFGNFGANWRYGRMRE